MRGAQNSEGLKALNDRLAEDLCLLELPAKQWVPARTHNGQHVRDVIIIGGGMCGLAACAKLVLSGVGNTVVYDEAPAGLEGPWITFARMKTLRSPKTLAGPALGLPSLTFRAWYTAQYGSEGWDRLVKIPKDIWMDYLIWYRHILDLPVQNEVRMTGISDAGNDLIAVTLEDAEGARTEYARHLVLATGRSGLGAGDVPQFMQGVNRRFWAHTSDDIDFAALKGKRIAVIGAGASAMDNAATALEHDAASLAMLIRRPDMPRINKMTGIGNQGVVHGMRYLPDAWKWKFVDYTTDQQTPPPRTSTQRVSRHPNARFYLNCPVLDVSEAGDHVVAETPHARFKLDFIIAATGFRNDFFGRPEFSAFASHIRSWRDRAWTPDMGDAKPFMADAPYLGDSFEFLEKTPGECPMLERIHCFNDAAMLSHGKLSGDIPAVSAGADRLMRGIVIELFRADRAAHFALLEAYDIPELEGDEWTDSTPELIKVTP